ncbi:protein prenylyltransferase [Ceraceosorus guamensis]|uniref:Geranylgeranyl transferase type-2 subunit alpha n=1 Tax=Ceraceosorus guamensis TaxID=1522189 RepID=A0A316VMK8_9BASI|nr:protein prenylyltransferase [Ceraceosorus guamensis]PWN38869.1 protein prenylyltransferase [Ceraceosorus guamensis]
MHGIKRSAFSHSTSDSSDSSSSSSAAARAKKTREAEKLRAYAALEESIFSARREEDEEMEMLKRTGELLGLNPEVYTVWSFRREIMQRMIGAAKRARDARARRLIGADVELTQHALKAHPKVYWIWNHRAWCLEHLPVDEDEVVEEEGRVDRQRLQSPRKWKRELKLVDGMLQMDGRNFHGWNYPYAALHLDLAAQELAYTLRHVEKDFSNFSAWHHRGIILCGYWKAKGWDVDRIRSARDEEFELIKQAMYTDPSDESIWNYHSWLIDQDASVRVLERECEQIEELLELEPDARYCMRALSQYNILLAAASSSSSSNSDSEKRKERAKQLLRRLQIVDALRKEEYKEMEQEI